MNIVETIAKPSIVGLTAGLMTRYVTYGLNSYGEPFALTVSSKLPMLSKMNDSKVNLALATGLMIGVSSLVSDLFADKMYTFLHYDEIFENAGSASVQMGATAVSSILMHELLSSGSSGDRGIFNIIGLSVLSDITGGIIYTKAIRPLLYDLSEEAPVDYVLPPY